MSPESELKFQMFNIIGFSVNVESHINQTHNAVVHIQFLSFSQHIHSFIWFKLHCIGNFKLSLITVETRTTMYIVQHKQNAMTFKNPLSSTVCNHKPLLHIFTVIKTQFSMININKHDRHGTCYKC